MDIVLFHVFYCAFYHSKELVKQDDIMVSPKTSRSNGESSRTPTRTTPVGTPKSGGKTPTSGGRTPRSRTRETKYGVQEGEPSPH